jgi:hypothetical protein
LEDVQQDVVSYVNDYNNVFVRNTIGAYYDNAFGSSVLGIVAGDSNNAISDKIANTENTLLSGIDYDDVSVDRIVFLSIETTYKRLNT